MSRHLLMLLALLCATDAAGQSLRIRVDGEVSNPGVQSHVEGARLAEAVVAAAPIDAAFAPAAMLTRVAAEQAQIRLKAGLMHDLGELERSGEPDVAAQARSLADWLHPMAVTGRVATELSPRRLEMTPAANLPLRDGDRVHYPRRRDDVRIVGAVVEPCTVPHVALQDAPAYLAGCPLQLADRDWLHVVQPDGSVQRIGIALWNHSEPQALAPGATILVPLAARALRLLDGDFNAELAEFLATQPVDAIGAVR